MSTFKKDNFRIRIFQIKSKVVSIEQDLEARRFSGGSASVNATKNRTPHKAGAARVVVIEEIARDFTARI
ncbi:MAG: hypothetical protein V3W08_09150 [Candidatus Binatia bacterium]